MLTFTINTDNAIDAFLNADAAASQGADAVFFGNQDQLGIVTAAWPLTRLATIHNEAAGVPPFGSIRPVAKFENRVVAVSRLWQMARTLANGMLATSAPAPQAEVPTATVDAVEAAAKAPKAKREPAPKTEPAPAAKAGTKQARAIALLNRKDGASNQEMQDEFGWQPHSCRGFLATLKTKMGLNIESFKTEAGERRYRINS